MKKENKKGGIMFGGFKTRPTFSVITLSVFVIFFVVIAIYIVYTSMASKEFGTSKNPNNFDDLTTRVLAEARDLKNVPASEKSAAAKKLADTAKARKELALNMMEEDPEGFLRVAITKELKNKMLDEVTTDIEEEGAFEGTLEVAFADDFDKKTSKRVYAIETKAGERLSVNFSGSKPDISNGAKVKFEGVSLGDSIVVDGDKPDAIEVLEESVLGAQTTKTAVALLFNFQDVTNEPFTAAKVREDIFTGSNSVRKYYQEVSHGSFDIKGKNNPEEGDVYGWFQIPVRASDGCKIDEWRKAALSEARKLGFSASGYSNVVLMFPRVSSCGWGGLGHAPGTYTWLNGISSANIIAHELGHNYGLWHAASRECYRDNVRVTTGGKCYNNDYGDPFDVMGGGNLKHFNAYYRGMMGFLGSGNAQTVSAAGRYDVYPLAKKDGVTSIRIPIERDVLNRQIYYYIEYRQPFGFDNYSSTSPVVNGVSVRIGYDYNANAHTYLLDMTPETNSFVDSALLPGKVFEDNERNIIIKTIDATTE
ncbi:hypothetical protein K0A96_02305, partial [Patescibacteria group bacterium]|nr:hypothetical protein [Patescibacteria group bacterium]